MKIAIVVPAHIPPSKEWIEALEKERAIQELAGAPITVDVVIVDDSNGNLGQLPEAWKVFDYRMQQEYLAELYEFFDKKFHKSSACRIFGHIWAYKEGYDIVVGLDSDCIVSEGFIKQHIASLSLTGFGWDNPLQFVGRYSRGYPYSQRAWPIMANMGLWKNVLDINGKDRTEDEPVSTNMPENGTHFITGNFPFSGMNFALRRNAVPLFLFLPNMKIEDDDFRRIDDVWGGYIFQKLAHKVHMGLSYGGPIVFHDTKVVAEEDAAEEAAMYKWEERFINAVDRAVSSMPSLEAARYADIYHFFAKEFLNNHVQDFFLSFELHETMAWWVKILQTFFKD